MKKILHLGCIISYSAYFRYRFIFKSFRALQYWPNRHYSIIAGYVCLHQKQRIKFWTSECFSSIHARSNHLGLEDSIIDLRNLTCNLINITVMGNQFSRRAYHAHLHLDNELPVQLKRLYTFFAPRLSLPFGWFFTRCTANPMESSNLKTRPFCL